MATQPFDHLNSFLRGEIAAVETYRQALDKVNDVQARMQLEQCHASHQHRVDLLKTRIIELGGEPSQGLGTWGAFAKAAEASAAALGERAAIDVLEEGEDHGSRTIRST